MWPHVKACRVLQETEDGSPVHLTPDQQRQLEMIESMPLLKEAEISAEEWDIKTPEEKEKILGNILASHIL